MIRILTTLLSGFVLAGCLSQPPAPAVDRTPSAQSKSAMPAQAPVAQNMVAPSGAGYYTVKKGDTLYRIALENGQDYKDVAVWNGLANPSSIKEGQVLRVAPPGAMADSVGTKPIGSGPVVESRPLDANPVAAAPVQASNDALKREPKVGKEPYSDEAYARLNKGDAPPKVVVDSKPETKEVKPEPPQPAGPDDVVWAWPSAGKMIAPFSDSGNKGLDFSGKAGDAVTAASDGKVVYAGSGLRGYGELVIVKHNATFLSAYAHNRKILVKEGQAVTRGQKIAEMGNSDSEAVKLHFEIRKQGKPIDPMQYLPKK